MKWLLVLGARSDIARACAERFAAAGWSLYLAGRNGEALARDARDLALRHSIEAQACPWDAQAIDGHRAFYESLPHVPAGVLCAVGYLGGKTSDPADMSEMTLIFETNLSGPAAFFEVAAADFQRRGSGFLVGIGSVAGDRGRKTNYLYGAAKAGFATYLQGLRNRLFPHGVLVVTVKPGFVATRMTKDMALPALLTAQPQEVARDIYRAVIRGKDIVYSKWYWRWIMLVIRLLPEPIFKRLNI